MRLKWITYFFQIILILLLFPQHGSALETGALFPVAMPDYSGDLNARPCLTGDWGGTRTNLADKGVVVFLDNMTTYQNVLNGGIKHTGETGGSIDLDLRMDLEKIGLWRRGFIRIFSESRYGHFINAYTGTLFSENADGLFPIPDKNQTALTSAGYYHFVSDTVCLYMGKLETLDRDANALAGGRGKAQFLHQNLVFNPVTIRAIPYSALGAGVSIASAKGEDVLSFTVLDPNGKPNVSGFDSAFDGGAALMTEFKDSFYTSETVSHQLFGFAYNTKNHRLLDSNPLLMLPEAPEEVINGQGRPKNSWCFYYNYDQLFVDKKEKPGEGFGFFLRFGYANEDVSPVEWFYSFGLCGNGIIDSRDKDTCGIGYYYAGISDNLPSYFNYLFDEQGVEIYYNIRITPWLHITPDFQVAVPSDAFVDNTIAAGVRIQINI